MASVESLKEMISGEFPGARVVVEDTKGTGDYLNITVISNRFNGKRRLEQHRLVMKVLEEPLAEHVHAVQIRTMTPTEARSHCGETKDVK